MKRIFVSLFLMFSPIFSICAQDGAGKKVWVTVDSDSVKSVEKQMNQDMSLVEENSGVSLIEVDEKRLPELSYLMHQKFQRCSGFMVHESFDDAQETLVVASEKSYLKSNPMVDYSLSEGSKVRTLLRELQELKIRESILKLSSFHNRYYKSDTGVESSKWIKDHWSKLAEGRSDVKVEEYKHSDFPQPSIILTIQGEEYPDEIVVVGGHADSIAGFWNRALARAPGADDNASGIATMTEVIRVLMLSGHRPARTVQFMAYAAEEVGLLGSQQIATDYKNKNKNVIGVLQLDMTNFNGSKTDIVMMDDYTNPAQNQFLATIIDEYLKISWGYSSCGYACSDHASWTRNNFAASIPFEAKSNEMNRQIHTANDTIQASNNNAEHAFKFSKVALAFVIELAK